MGFFDELGSLLGEVASMGGELKQTADDAATSITESTEELTSIKVSCVGFWSINLGCLVIIYASDDNAYHYDRERKLCAEWEVLGLH